MIYYLYMSKTAHTQILLIEKNATVKEVSVKDTWATEDLYKKCGFKKPDGFQKQTEWKIKIEGTQYFVSVYAKEEGRANGENKYDFPPPIDNKLFFGSCAIVAERKDATGARVHESLTRSLWEKMLEKLFGGFEDLKMTILADEEEDELANVPAHKKTKEGYFKDGFVVDSDGSDPDNSIHSDEDDDEMEYPDEEDSHSPKHRKEQDDEDELLEDLNSELSEESYESESE